MNDDRGCRPSNLERLAQVGPSEPSGNYVGGNGIPGPNDINWATDWERRHMLQLTLRGCAKQAAFRKSN
jgi:hypothetical protein